MQASNDLDVLDAGCGTGLCGPLLAPYARRLVGVDLSERMLDQARARDVYDELVKGELTEYLAASAGTFDAIVSADTLVYFGPLEAVAEAAERALRPGGPRRLHGRGAGRATATRSASTAATAMRAPTSSAPSLPPGCRRRSKRPSCDSRPATRFRGWSCGAPNRAPEAVDR